MTAPDLPDGLVAPSYDTTSLAAVLPAAAGAMGHELSTSTGLTAAGCRAALGLPDADRVVVVLVDGLGIRNLAERGGHAPFLRGLLRERGADAATLTSSFPSTTAAGLSILGTGTAPGRTGMLGYTQRNPATGRLAAVVQWKDLGDPADVQREPTVFEALVAAGARVTAPGPRKFAGSGMTQAALRGPAYVAAETFEQRVDATVAALRAPGGGQRLVYLYQGDVDKIGHGHGWDSWQWGDALESTDRELQRLLRSVPRGTLVLVTADHGQIKADLTTQWDVAADPALRPGVAMVGGEPRAAHVYTEPGTDPADVARRWAERLGDHAVVVLRERAVADGWFGPVAEHVLPSIGDVVVAMTGAATVVDSRVHSAAARALPGVHGSLTPHEMLVPLLTAVA
ncbi:type I phosphodiesterase/nucleotide pyrophosphatase [Promicromonospora sp. AC04]|uniref:alkaline phosphatase family protein n=1 Tax=Promicromonospora sp. AC04 TaxID=2135723 RepID=UPI000D389D96|nr:nucleotide pyrophosphatase/phosphodiesterase family protein [Promicromonospora sp. AC04]PUB25599.1 type I phosphodiesterase/nucleotide pyrophosphatase [Promicromonospora sp. AC04]